MALIVCLSGCNETSKPKATETQVNPSVVLNTKKDKQEIQKLVRNLLVWAEDHKQVPDLLPFIVNRQDSTVTGFDLSKLKGIDDSLRNTGFFSDEFINNYNKIIQVLYSKMKDKQIAPFYTGEIPPFGFATDADPWCYCQEVPYDHPNPFGLVDVHIIELNNEDGKLYWTWGSLPKDALADWKDVRYNFNVKKEGDKWKISYLQGFDIKMI
ncbi:hypothetical protein EWM62_09370 [Mucilaginibacter terrigena]|uniref:Uncharacterized protein n=1 Tax=Mucilaginibacter terrigena TaxID=2492395 RepID=A0A4Q5LM36_9SPHI|nr:hypothetical protein [Mucilaginibacter terrigena]RYU90841.1 hypothetical protein EWM62_09370 [Mucilaginibacter terrigena]